MFDESQFHAWLAEHLPGSPRLAVPLGDDAAVLHSFGSAGIVVTTDLVTDGVDFLIDQVDPQLIGHKALGVNLSDLAAMAARPVAAFVSLVLPRTGTQRHSAEQLAQEIYTGLLTLAKQFDVVIAGGDTNTWDAPLAINITLLGETTDRGPLTRSGGRVGDQLLATGSFGGSILGRHLHVEPRVREALLLHERYELHAGIDVSDGLALDVSRLAKASACGAVLDLDCVPISDSAQILAIQTGQSTLDHALGDGEDFELTLAVPPADAERLLSEQPIAPVTLTRIGQLVAESGLHHRKANGKIAPLEPTGYLHRSNP